MGKKKRQKMKELSVAIAESAASKVGGESETKQQESQPQLPRKRGRPRKVIREEGKFVETTMDEAEAAAATQGIMNMEKKQEEEEEEHEASAKEEEDIQLPKREPSRSRARRKSKPRKST